jgi:hypothetical protein
MPRPLEDRDQQPGNGLVRTRFLEKSMSLNIPTRAVPRLLLSIAMAATVAAPAAAQSGRTLRLHPDNPRYFLYQRKPTVLITSGEHYGAVLNQDFNYIPYLAELEKRRFNLTRTFSGSYVEIPGSFKIQRNTLAPVQGRFICPWARSTTPGYPGGGNKFDLTKWDDAYFKRLKDFVRQAGRRGVVVELVLFCPFYEDSMWNHSPMNAANNVNGVGNVPRLEALTLKDSSLVAVQEAMVRKIVEELKGAPNLYYEICNEPYFGGVTLDWQARIAQVIAEAESSLPEERRHLIAQNIANGAKKVESPNPLVSIFNFHYASPPDAVAQNRDLNRVIGFDETGFRGTRDLPYRSDAWDFLMAGGAVYSNLDYSFTAEKPDGTAPVTDPTPGGGGPSLRSQLQTLHDFMRSIDFHRMRPDSRVIKSGTPEGGSARALVDPGKAYAIYIKGGPQATLSLTVPAGKYTAEWINPRSGNVDKIELIKHEGGELKVQSPLYVEDVALRVLARKPEFKLPFPVPGLPRQNAPGQPR